MYKSTNIYKTKTLKTDSENILTIHNEQKIGGFTCTY